MNGIDLARLPNGWIWAKIGSICDLINGRAFKAEDWSSSGLPIIRIQNLNDPNAEFNFCNFKVEDRYLVDNGQLLFAWSGTPGTSFGAHIWKKELGILNQHIFKVNINEQNLDKIFLKYVINYNILQYINKAHGTAGLAHITKSKFESSLIPLPPLPEQHRIVARIEELFSRLDAGIEALQKAKAQLRQYRQSVLKAAVEGRLTEEWRKAHPEVEPAEMLLDRINQKRQKYAIKKLKEAIFPDFSSTTELPSNWKWATVEQLGPSDRTCAYGVLQPGPDVENGIPLIRVGDVESGKIRKDNLKKIDPKIAAEYERTKLKGGEVLITLVGAIGRTAVVPDSLIGANTARAVGVIPLNEELKAEWVEIWFRNPDKIIEMTSKAHEVARKTLNLEDVRSALVAIPPLAEQGIIINEIESRLSLVENAEDIINKSQKRSEKLRQSILKCAFEGKLVPQEPNDEPAPMLLERIREERFTETLARSKKHGADNTHQMRLTQ